MLIGLLIAQLSSAQLPAAMWAEPARLVAHGQRQTSSVTGVVHDSISNRPLVGATVQLVAADTLARFGESVISDSLGVYRFRDVPEGKYTIGFFHPMLDSLGMEPMLRAVTVSGARLVQSDLAIPSAASLSSAVCGPSAAGRAAAALLIGVVRDAHTREPAANVTVAGEWVELSIRGAKMVRNTPRRVVTTRDNGWFAICNVPAPGTMTLTASRNADSTDVVEVQIPAEGFLRRELYLSRARTVVVYDTLRPNVQTEPRALHVGDQRLKGTVSASNGGRPLANAQVSIVNGPTTRTNARGEWTLSDAPAGTRSLEVRAVGYYPDRRTVDVIDGTPAISLSLVTFKSVLDTMKVLANYDLYSNLAGFRARRRSGVGRYFTSNDFEKVNAVVTSDLFLTMPGVYIEYLSAEDTVSAFGARVSSETAMGDERKILMRGSMSRRCVPSIHVNGQWMPNMSTNDVDGFLKPSEIAAVEVYVSAQVPPHFQPALGGCGSIVFWTK